MSWKTVALNSDLYTYEYLLKEYVCRICWCQNGVKEITANTSEDVETSVATAEIILEFIGIDLTVTRPSKICSSCWSEVENFSEFRSFCHETQRKLNNTLQKGQTQSKSDLYKESNSIEIYRTEVNEFSDLELTSTISNLFEELSNGLEEPQSPPRKTKKTKKLRSDTYCTSCKTDFASQDLFTQHNVDIHGLENGFYKCFGCERLFKHRKRCLRHEAEYCKPLKNGYKCGICQKFLQKRGSFENHLRAHHADRHIDLPDEPFRCKKCEKEFISMDILNQHMKMHDEDKKNWVCDTCGRVFTRRDYLYKHKLMHEGRKLHACPHCDFRTIQKSSLNVHIRKHTGERPYPCAVCPQRCVNSSNLREHMRRHLGIKQFQCTLCDKKFGYKISLQEHISSIHERSEVHSCAECGATYSRFRGLRRHLAAKHGKHRSKMEIPCENQPNAKVNEFE